VVACWSGGHGIGGWLLCGCGAEEPEAKKENGSLLAGAGAGAGAGTAAGTDEMTFDVFSVGWLCCFCGGGVVCDRSPNKANRSADMVVFYESFDSSTRRLPRHKSMTMRF
jgi:hypothetical protein